MSGPHLDAAHIAGLSSVGLGSSAKRGLLNLFGLAGNVGDAIGESWPLVVMGLLGSALLIRGLLTLIYGEW